MEVEWKNIKKEDLCENLESRTPSFLGTKNLT